MKAFLRRLMAVVPFLFVLPAFVLAQENMEDVIYLKNGSVIHGVIIEQVPNVSLKIQTADRNVFVFRIEEVDKITKEPLAGKAKPSGRSETAASFSNEELKQRGYSAIAELNMGIGYNGFGEKSSFGVQVINGYQVNPNLFAGIGIGLNQHFSGVAFAPIFLDVRVNFLRQRVSPFIDLAGGWAIGLTDDDEGGVYANPSLGVKFFVSRRTALQLSLGFRYQEGTERIETWNYYNGTVTDHYDQTFERNAATLKFGVTF
ncbi:MAG: hypothetical protein ABI599_16030 [Flavobacteriales bacterium]